MAEEALPGAGGRASALLANIAERRWDQVRAGFNQRMADALDVSGLAAAWAQVIGGPRVPGHGRAGRPPGRRLHRGERPAAVRGGRATGRVSYDRAGQVAGLYFV